MVGKHQRLTGTPPMSTKASVASSKWSKSFCSFSHLAPPFCENKVILNRVNVSSLCPKLQNVPISDVLCENPEKVSDHQKQHGLMYLRWFGGVAGQKGPSKKQPNKISIVAYSLVTHLRLAGCSSPQPPPTTCLLPPLLDLGRAERLLTPKHEPRKKSLNLLVLSALPGPDESLPKPMSTVTNAHLLTLSFDLGGAVRLSVSKHKSRKKSLNLLVLSAPSGPDDSLPKPMSNFTNACIANYRLTYLTLTLMLSSWILKNQPWKKVTQAPSSLGVGPKAPVQINAVSLFGTKVSIAKKFTQPPGCPEVGQKLLKPRSKVTESHVANNRLFGLTPVCLVLKHESRKSLPELTLIPSLAMPLPATLAPKSKPQN